MEPQHSEGLRMNLGPSSGAKKEPGKEHLSPSRLNMSNKLKMFDTSQPRSPLGDRSNGALSRGNSIEPGMKVDLSMLSPAKALQIPMDDELAPIQLSTSPDVPLGFGGLSPVASRQPLPATPEKASSPSLLAVNAKVKRFEAAMDKPDPSGMRKSKATAYHTGFFGYAVLDYAAMTEKVAEQV